MTKKLYLPLLMALIVALSSCGNKMGELSSDYFTVTPQVLEAVGGKVPATINGKFPEKYFNKKAVVEVTPVLKWNGGEAKGQPATFQGEKVEGNDQTISYKMGGNYTVMAAAYTPGVTTIYNAACEPYVQQLCRMLSQMGVKIEGIGSNLLRITGTDHIGGADHTILPDMIEVGSFIGMAALTQSELTIKDVSYDNLGIIPDSFRRLGIRLERRGDDIFIPAQDVYEIETNLDGSIPTIADAPWPGLTPDLLSVMLVTATQCRGSVLIHQKMFESRLFFVDRLIDMGAQIMLCDPHRAVVIGLDHKMPLRANNMHSPDIRAGIAMLIAALSAKGMSTIDNIDQIDRGYEAIDTRLSSAGACISRRE